MSEDDDLRVGELLEEYLQAYNSGLQPAADEFLSKCSAGAVERLRMAMEGIDFALQGYGADTVKESTVHRTLGQIHEIQRKRQELAVIRERASQREPVPPKDPAGYLAGLLGAPTTELAIRAASRATQTHPEQETWDPVVGRSSTRNGLQDSEAQLQVLEAEIAERTEELLERFQVQSSPVDVNTVAERLNLFVKEACLDGLDGCLVTHNDVGAALINIKATSKQRKRFALAHEIGHYVLHRRMRMQFRDTLGAWGSLLYDQEEFEADTFAAMLLMPDFLLPPKMSGEQPSLARAKDLARTFDVPLAAALRRIVRASKWPCALAIIKAGVIQCWTRSPELKGYVRNLHNPPSSSMAARLTQTATERVGAATLPATAWFGGPIAGEDATVVEHTQRVNGGYIYSLITVL